MKTLQMIVLVTNLGSDGVRVSVNVVDKNWAERPCCMSAGVSSQI